MAFSTSRMIFGGLVLAAFSISGCTEECTEVGCTDSITVTFDRDIPRDYTVEITFNGVKGTADCTQATNPGNEEVEVPVSGLDGNTLLCRPNGALLQGAPEEVVFTFTFAGGGVAEVALAPKYNSVTPNGEECGPVCDQSEVEVALPADG